MKVIEKKHQFDELIHHIQTHSINECFVVPIFVDSNKHPLNNKLSLLYLEMDEDYMICFDHSETLGVSIDSLQELNSINTIYTDDKKELNHIFRWNNVIDLSMWYYLNTSKPLEFDEITTSADSTIY